MIKPNDYNNPTLWNSVLEEVEKVFPNSSPVIAGGAIRDFHFNLDPKDIDVFINFDGDEFDLEMQGISLYNSGKLMLPGEKTDPAKYGRKTKGSDQVFTGDLIGVIETWNRDVPLRGDIPVQVIAMPYSETFSARAVVETFDAHVNQCWYWNNNGNMEMGMTDGARKDIDDKTWTLTRKYSDAAAHRFNRVNDRFYYETRKRPLSEGGEFSLRFVDPKVVEKKIEEAAKKTVSSETIRSYQERKLKERLNATWRGTTIRPGMVFRDGGGNDHRIEWQNVEDILEDINPENVHGG